MCTAYPQLRLQEHLSSNNGRRNCSRLDGGMVKPVTETAPIIYLVMAVTITKRSGNSKPAAPAHGEHTILSVAGKTPSTPW